MRRTGILSFPGVCEGGCPQNKRTNYTEGRWNAVRAYRWKIFESDRSDLIDDRSVKWESVNE